MATPITIDDDQLISFRKKLKEWVNLFFLA